MARHFPLSKGRQFKVILVSPGGDFPEVVIESLDHSGYQSRRTCMKDPDASPLCVDDRVVVENATATSLRVKRCSDGGEYHLYWHQPW
jgi:hypothetical protein